MKHQVAAQQRQRAQTKRKYIASEAAPSAAFQAKLAASGGIVAVSSLAKNKLDFSGGRQQAPAAAQSANGPQHTRFDDSGQPVKAEAAAAAPAATGAASNKSAAQLLRERLKGGGGGGGSSSGGQPAEQQQQAAADGVKTEPQEGQQDSGPVPEPSPKRVKVEGAGSQDSDGDKNMSDAVSPSAAAAANGAADEAAQQGVKQEGDGTMEDVAALPEDEVSGPTLWRSAWVCAGLGCAGCWLQYCGIGFLHPACSTAACVCVAPSCQLFSGFLGIRQELNNQCCPALCAVRCALCWPVLAVHGCRGW